MREDPIYIIETSPLDFSCGMLPVTQAHFAIDQSWLNFEEGSSGKDELRANLRSDALREIEALGNALDRVCDFTDGTFGVPFFFAFPCQWVTTFVVGVKMSGSGATFYASRKAHIIETIAMLAEDVRQRITCTPTFDVDRT